MSDELSESARAAQEVAKAARTGIEATEKLGRFVSKVTGESIDAVTGILADRLRFMRWQRQLRLLDRCSDILRERGIVGRLNIVSPKLALPIIESASLEEDDELQDLWANLLTTALDPSFKRTIRSAFIDIIKQLDAVDVRILHFIYDWNEQRLIDYHQATGNMEGYTAHEREYLKYPVERGLIIQELNLDSELYVDSIDNLFRVRCLAPYVDYERVVSGTDARLKSRYIEVPILYDCEVVCLTTFGISFVLACLGSSSSRTKNQ